MKNSPVPPAFPAGIVKLSDMDLSELEGKNTALARIFDTREVRQALAAVLPDLLAAIAGDRRGRKFFFNIAGRFIESSLRRPEDVFERPELAPLFNDPGFIRHLAGPLPALVGGLADLAATALETLEHLEFADKKDILGSLISETATGRTGDMITRVCRILNDLHRNDPEFFTKRLAPGFRKWIESLDFGELKEMAENSRADIRAFAVMVNTVMWQYPSKVVLLLSLIPTAANILSDALEISLQRLNELPPDLLTDVILSFLRETEIRPIGGVVNELLEIIRKIHTGSALLGEPGAPQLPKLLSAKVAEIIDRLDPATFWKAAIALAETKAALAQATAAAVSRRPDLLRLNLVNSRKLANLRMKSLNQKLSWWDDQEDAALAEHLSAAVAAHDIHELGEAVNSVLRIFNRLNDQKPDLAADAVRQLVHAVDPYEVSEAAQKLFGAAEAAKPLARAVVPGLVKWAAAVLAPADDEYEQDAREAREALASLFSQKEV